MRVTFEVPPSANAEVAVGNGGDSDDQELEPRAQPVVKVNPKKQANSLHEPSSDTRPHGRDNYHCSNAKCALVSLGEKQPRDKPASTGDPDYPGEYLG